MIQFEDVTKTYKNGVRALTHININIDEGEFVYLIGPTGSGKSTFIKLINREEKATSGRVIVNGKDVAKIRNSRVPYFRRKVGVVFQNYRLLPRKTVAENVAFALEVIDTPKRHIDAKVKHVLKLVGLSDKAGDYPRLLSGGEQQRVAIARAIVNSPAVLIADEPTGNLDPDTSHEIITLLEEINKKEGTTVVVVTHDKEMVQTHVNRTIYLDAGDMVSDSLTGGYKK